MALFENRFMFGSKGLRALGVFVFCAGLLGGVGEAIGGHGEDGEAHTEVFTLSGGAVGVSIVYGALTTEATYTLMSDGTVPSITSGFTSNTFVIAADITDPALTLGGALSNTGDSGEFRIDSDGVVASVAFSPDAPTDGAVHLQNINTITIDGGTANGAIDASTATAAVTFNLTSGLIRGGVTGTDMVDNFVIGVGITGGGMLDGGLGADTLSFAAEFTTANLFDNALTLGLDDGSSIEFTLANIAMADIVIRDDLTLTRTALPLTFLPAAGAGADTFAISSDITDGTQRQLDIVIDGLDGTDEFQLNTGAVVASISFSDQAPTGPTAGEVHLQNIETIRLNGGMVTGDVTGSAGDETFIIAGDMATDTDADTNGVQAALAIGGVINGAVPGTTDDGTTLDVNEAAGGSDELRLDTGAVVASIAFSSTGSTDGAVNLQNIETITLNGGTVTGAIDASAATAAVTFNLTSGTITTGGVTGTSMVDSFVIGADITVGGTLDGGLGADTLSLATGFTPDLANFFGGILTLTFSDGSLELTLANIAIADIDVGSLTITELNILTFTRATGADNTFAITTDITGDSPTRPLITPIDGLGGD